MAGNHGISLPVGVEIEGQFGLKVAVAAWALTHFWGTGMKAYGDYTLKEVSTKHTLLLKIGFSLVVDWLT